MSDRILTYTRAVAVIVIPFLVAASFLLYVLPGSTDQLFAWTIAPPFTAMLLACAYLGGIWFFLQVVVQRRWHRVKHGFPAVFVFATLLGIATFLHWDRFHFGHISFITWVTLYLTTPVLALLVLILNWREDDGRFDERDTAIPVPLRIVLALIGAGSLITGLTLFIAPGILIDVWAWPLTPLTARVVGAVVTLPGMVNLWMLAEPRWSAFRWVFQAQLISLGFMALAILIFSRDFIWSRPAAWLFVIGIAASLLIYLAVYVSLDRARIRRPELSASSSPT
ncbi:hypothetical protein WDJ51_09970 [Rathayibacter sp. YIM 133350]|uniref:hypothetical protein n=1 Tax=Rathayibacter sp. YIM 133350 TaxID=3131992 RepID=UPI00307DA461